jgi:ribosomal protein L37AE/L43A
VTAKLARRQGTVVVAQVGRGGPVRSELGWEVLMNDVPTEAVPAEELRCPNCGAEKPLRIAYGYPSHDMWEASERGHIALGGCIVQGDSPTWECRKCGHSWGDPPMRIEGLAAFFPRS